MKSELSGIWPAVASPCDADGVFLEDNYAELIASLYRTEIKGLYVCGSTERLNRKQPLVWQRSRRRCSQ